MKRILMSLLLMIGLLSLLGCTEAPTNQTATPTTDTFATQTTINEETGTEIPETESTGEETTEPETTEVETTEPVTTVPETTEPETTVPETTEPETTVPETTVPETTVPETTVPETTIPETTIPETTVPETTVPETTVPETTVPETTVPETTEAETTIPETTEAETTIPETTVPETTEAENTETETTEEEIDDSPASPLRTGWLDRNGKRYYRDENGELHTGWLELDGDRYYFYDNYSMATGCVEIPGLGKRYFASSGKEVVLVNPWNKVPEEYTVKLGSYGGYSMAEHIVDPLKQMLADCKDAGHTAIVCSAYRRHEDQIYLHNRRIQRFLDQGYSEEDAKREAARRVAVPGTSEHELGLALDIVDINYQNLTEKQETMPAQQWLMANSWKYGFILRYPNEKSEITGIIYEPWHYRYVGIELAKEIHDSGLCLEEYLQQLTERETG